MRLWLQVALSAALALTAGSTAHAAKIQTATEAVAIARLTTNARTDPLGIGAENLSFGWALESRIRGARQRAYQVQVGRQPGGAEIWDSGRRPSTQQSGVLLSLQRPLDPGTRYYWRVRVWDQAGGVSHWSAPAWFETGLLSDADWGTARWVGAVDDDAAQPRPLLRSEFALTQPVKRARLYATAQGVYQIWLNGQPVGNHVLAPGWTDYRQRLQVQTFDVTPLLSPGANAMGAALADGWFRGKVGLGWRATYGGQLAFKALLRVTYADGSTQDFGTDERWQSALGPFVQADLQDGERYDARRSFPDWDRPGDVGPGWRPVAVRATPRARLVPQPDEPVRAVEVLPARTRSPSAGGDFIYDVGQNVVGVARVRVSGRAGQTLRLRYAEELYRTGPRRGQLYTDNFRSAAVTDHYTFARDETVTYQPRFTQHGFRYIEVSGVDGAPEPADVSAVVLGSDLPVIGELRLSHPMLDQLVRNIRRGQRGNFLSIPTDTPARDERLGWTGDIAVFAPTASRFQDTRAFLMKWMDDVRDAQRPDGNIPAVVPQPTHDFTETGVGWSDAVIHVPYAVWRASGDTQILRRNWLAMRRFYDFLHASATADGNLLEEGRASWFSGDWLNLEGVDRLSEHRVIATAYFAEDTRMMAEMAAALGETEQAQSWSGLARRIREAFAQAYRSVDGRIAFGTQTVYAMALGMGLLEAPRDRESTASQYVAKLAADGNHLKTGFLGTPWLLPALTVIGRDDLSMALLLNEDYPSWGFEIRMGATTMWERWNSIQPDGEFGPVEMNSFNHYAYGAVGDWMFRRLGGLQMLEPGYRKVLVAPLVTHPALAWASSSIQTTFGLLFCQWHRTSTGLELELVIPPSVDAEVRLPAASADSVREGLVAASRSAGVRRLPAEPGEVRLQVASGHYRFRVDERIALMQQQRASGPMSH
jgi:alpha-L-rhamnosidase